MTNERKHNKEYHREYNKRYKEAHKEEIARKRRERTKARRKATDWSIIMDYVREELADFTSKGIKPTLRSMHYRLYSKHSNEPKIYARYGNTQKYYWGLSKATTAAREGTTDYYGQIPIDCFADDTREALYPKNTELNYELPKEFTKRLIKQLKDLKHNYEKELIPRWLNQPNYVEVWTEKKTMIPTLQNIIGDRDVAIVPLGGQPSVTFMWDNASVLNGYQEMQYEYKDENGETQTDYKTIHIFYLGDLDPSGEGIQESVEEKLGREPYSIYNLNFQRLAVTKKQVDDLGLPQDPDPETLSKLHKDNNRHKFIGKYKKLMQIEIDALVAYDPDGLRNMIQKAIDGKFDERIHKQMLEQYSPESIGELVEKSVRYEFNLRNWW